MQRAIVLATMILAGAAAGIPDIAFAEPQRARARVRGGGQAAGAPRAVGPAVRQRAPVRSAPPQRVSRPASQPRSTPPAQVSRPASRPASAQAPRTARPRRAPARPPAAGGGRTAGAPRAVSPPPRQRRPVRSPAAGGGGRSGRPARAGDGGSGRGRPGVSGAPRRVAVPRNRVPASGVDGNRRGRRPIPTAPAVAARGGRGGNRNPERLGGAPRTPGGAVRTRGPGARRPAGPHAVARRAVPRAPGQLARPGGYRRVHRPGFAYPQVYGSYFYSPVFGHGYGYNPYYYGYPRAYGSYFHFGGYPYTVGYGYPWIYDAAWGYGQTPYYGVFAGDRSDYYQGSLRLKIKPREAEVYADGYYVGVVDSFDGVFQRLQLEEGPHRIEISHPEYRPIVREVLIVAGETVTWEERMQPN